MTQFFAFSYVMVLLVLPYQIEVDFLHYLERIHQQLFIIQLELN